MSEWEDYGGRTPPEERTYTHAQLQAEKEYAFIDGRAAECEAWRNKLRAAAKRWHVPGAAGEHLNKLISDFLADAGVKV